MLITTFVATGVLHPEQLRHRRGQRPEVKPSRRAGRRWAAVTDPPLANASPWIRPGAVVPTPETVHVLEERDEAASTVADVNPAAAMAPEATGTDRRAPIRSPRARRSMI